MRSNRSFPVDLGVRYRFLFFRCLAPTILPGRSRTPSMIEVVSPLDRAGDCEISRLGRGPPIHVVS